VQRRKRLEKKMSNRLSFSGLVLMGAMVVGYAAPVLAAPLDLSYSETYNGNNTVLSGAGATNTLLLSSSNTYTHTFASPTLVIPGTVGISNAVPGGFGFYDDFLFTIPAATANSITSTISLANILGINDLQVRLYSATQSNPLPILGTPNGGVVDGWTTVIAPGGSVSVISPTNLGAGTYVLEVRGNVFGSSGGSYAGVLNVASVPVPATLWLFGSAIGGLISIRRRKVLL
jgi:hypothetical protein